MACWKISGCGTVGVLDSAMPGKIAGTTGVYKPVWPALNHHSRRTVKTRKKWRPLPSSCWLRPPALLSLLKSKSNVEDRALLVRPAILRVHLTTLHLMETVHLDQIVTQKSVKRVRGRQILTSTLTTARPTSTTTAEMEQTAGPMFAREDMLSLLWRPLESKN